MSAKDREKALGRMLDETKLRLGKMEADAAWYRRQRDDALTELAQTQAVLADALAERLPPWLAGLVDEKIALAESLRGYNETGGCECGYTPHCCGRRNTATS